MHGYALQRRLQNVGITVSSLNPGIVSVIGHIFIIDCVLIFRSLLTELIKDWRVTAGS